ncbi:hypothetical protein APS_2393 [Acetobacter pasteurianus subsp. pasteurianus LMG 1262 = NBRC 106471]|nr:hypothetical protein APS_2393 [Acetobacter pasteurianus subsp. pasteurianus LMG 1262 = NBRC 106471]
MNIHNILKNMDNLLNRLSSLIKLEAAQRPTLFAGTMMSA